METKVNEKATGPMAILCFFHRVSLPARLLASCRLPSILPAMTIAELIYEQVKRLPDQAAREVLDFVGYIRERGRAQATGAT